LQGGDDRFGSRNCSLGLILCGGGDSHRFFQDPGNREGIEFGILVIALQLVLDPA
jgi:hypothetical protein